MGKSIDELEREIDESRARLDQTIDRIQDRLTVTGMIDELVGKAPGAPLSGLFDRALVAARRNPVPLLVAAAGIGLLLQRLGRERRFKDDVTARRARRRAEFREEESVAIIPEPLARTYDPDHAAGQAKHDVLQTGRDEEARA